MKQTTGETSEEVQQLFRCWPETQRSTATRLRSVGCIF